ncbi:hypothetical protein MKW98_025210 [Papaver atlanticum]|uniref:Uncharacterized protein n=1 Tax=Papaver atlanticum TaxID=357466 RepID=A0AAD4S1H0_9MAGN|nr:hypothetical protein MKW98_025210 [Papaver atlanticum]
MSKTTSLCFSPLFIGLIFILAALMNSEGVDGVKCTEVPFTDLSCDFMCRNHFGPDVPIVWWKYHEHSLSFLDKNWCTCCVDNQYLNEGLHTCALIPYNPVPDLPAELACLVRCEENLGFDFPISAANYIEISLNFLENNTCQCCTKVSG